MDLDDAQQTLLDAFVAKGDSDADFIIPAPVMANEDMKYNKIFPRWGVSNFNNTQWETQVMSRNCGTLTFACGLNAIIQAMKEQHPRSEFASRSSQLASQELVAILKQRGINERRTIDPAVLDQILNAWTQKQFCLVVVRDFSRRLHNSTNIANVSRFGDGSTAFRQGEPLDPNQQMRRGRNLYLSHKEGNTQGLFRAHDHWQSVKKKTASSSSTGTPAGIGSPAGIGPPAGSSTTTPAVNSVRCPSGLSFLTVLKNTHTVANMIRMNLYTQTSIDRSCLMYSLSIQETKSVLKFQLH